MREIRFRAWDTNNKKYYYDVQNTHDGNIGDSFQSIIDSENFIIEQDTGIEDANSVSVYEGDVVAEIIQFDDDEPDIYEVVYNEDRHYPAFDLKGWTGEMNGISELSLTNGIKVIGNIHKQPELLVSDTDRISPDDIGNNIHEFLHGGDK